MAFYEDDEDPKQPKREGKLVHLAFMCANYSLCSREDRIDRLPSGSPLVHYMAECAIVCSLVEI
jgi:hypothetical protein